jgi:hypothetical protein
MRLLKKNWRRQSTAPSKATNMGSFTRQGLLMRDGAAKNCRWIVSQPVDDNYSLTQV